MARLLYAGLALILLLLSGGLLWWGLSGDSGPPPSHHSIEGLADTTHIEWKAQETATVTTTSVPDALTAIGYVHGIQRGWTVAVWRRTALGTLSSQFGPDLVPLDRHARRLGFARHAQQTYEQLPAEDRQRLQAYVRGLNAALRSQTVQRHTPFVSLGWQPDRWAPWHPLAVERLLAWIGTDPQALEETGNQAVERFRTADRRLRRWLHLHDQSRSVAWAAGGTADTARTVLFARHVLGATADPVIQELVVRQPDGARTAIASLPGAPIFPTGTSEAHSWTYLLGSRATLDRTAIDSSQVRIWHERISPLDGEEQLVRVRRSDRALLLDRSSTPTADSIMESPPDQNAENDRRPLIPADSAWVLRWPGFEAGTDLPRWMAEVETPPPTEATAPFHLIRGDGLILDSTEEWSVQGEPRILEQVQNGVLIGRSSWAGEQAESLRARATAPAPSPARWSASDSSAWAAQLLSRLLPGLTPLSGTDPVLDDALVYLRNWDAHYGRSSIGAVLFEHWMRAYRNEVGHLPSATDLDYFTSMRGRRTFRQAVRTLEARYGTDVRRWRWERVAAQQRHFLVWSADSLVSTDLSALSTTQYAPLRRPGRGHASALSGGPTLVDPPPLGPSPARWEGWMRHGDPTITARRLRFDPSAFFARSLLQDERPAPVSTEDATVSETTELVPVNP